MRVADVVETDLGNTGAETFEVCACFPLLGDVDACWVDWISAHLEVDAARCTPGGLNEGNASGDELVDVRAIR